MLLTIIVYDAYDGGIGFDIDSKVRGYEMEGETLFGLRPGVIVDHDIYLYHTLV